MSNWENLGDMFTPDGLARLKAGQVLVFDYEGERIKFKIMRITGSKCWAKRVTLYREDQVKIIDKDAA